MAHTYSESKALVDKYSEELIGKSINSTTDGLELAKVSHVIIVPAYNNPNGPAMQVIIRCLDHGMDNENALIFVENHNKTKYTSFDVCVVGTDNNRGTFTEKLEIFLEELR